jgi:predicted ArsR family transcriptional regulator
MPARGLRTYYKTLDSLSRVNLLHELQTRGGLTIDELAEATGLHPNTAREHLHRLIAIGLVRADPQLRGSRGRPTLRYRVESASRGADATQHQLEALGEHMGRCGFDATIEPGGHRMTMRDCPFAALSEDNPQVCQVHRALIADALSRVAGPVRAGELRRLVTEHECTLDLTREESATTSSV